MELTLKDMGRIIKKSWILILTLAVAGTAIGYGFSALLIQKQYRATAMMIISNTMQYQNNNSEMTLSDYNLNAQLVSSYSVLSKSDRVLTQLRDKLGLNIDLDKLSEKITISSKEDTDIFSLAVTDPSPQMAQKIANTLVDVFKTEVASIMKMDNVQVIDYAALPLKPVSPNLVINSIAGGLFGLVIALLIAVFRYVTDDTLKESDMIISITGIPVIGNVPKMQ